MTQKILVDASHPEQIRLVLADEEKLLDFEVEAPGKEQQKGNFYVGEVSRVEPSLQAAFITYGATRNGFLAFGELHPSYFNVDKAEQEELLKELEDIAMRKRGMDEDDNGKSSKKRPSKAKGKDTNDGNADDEDLTDEELDARALAAATAMADGDDANDSDDKKKRQPPIHRRYRIEDVLKEGQKILVQIVKEERGTKGAALTTYYSMPGRYTVLMPNTAGAGGVSRKINEGDERKKLKDAVEKLKVPLRSSLIVRTAGVGQDAKGIATDYKNVNALWEKLQKDFVKAEPSTCLHEEGNIVTRALRDMVSDDVDEIIIAGPRVYKQAKDFAKALLPDVAKRIKQYKGDNPIFIEHEVEQELNELFQTRVLLPSGGYIIINQTEALVAIDVNSGRNTGSRNLEDTAFQTNLEAAEEVCRQLRLRDLSGLIVVDFIDMERYGNNRKLEQCMRKHLRRDRARVQCSNLSNFGLIEISRQRLRPSIVEATLERCPHCHGAGWVPSTAAAALTILRSLEQDNVRASADRVIISTATDLAVYMLNNKRDLIRELEDKYKFQIMVRADDKFIAPDHQLELIVMKADGSLSSKVVNVSLREDPEAAPEAKTAKSRRARRKQEASAKKSAPSKSSASKSDSNDNKSNDDKKSGSNTKGKSKRPQKADAVAQSSAKTETKDDSPETVIHSGSNADEPKSAPMKRGRRPRRARPIQLPDDLNPAKAAEAEAEKPKAEAKVEKTEAKPAKTSTAKKAAPKAKAARPTRAKKPQAEANADLSDSSVAAATDNADNNPDGKGKGLFKRLWTQN